MAHKKIATADSSTLLDTHDVADRLKDVSPRTIERCRTSGDWPKFIKVGKRVLYRASASSGGSISKPDRTPTTTVDNNKRARLRAATGLVSVRIVASAVGVHATGRKVPMFDPEYRLSPARSATRLTSELVATQDRVWLLEPRAADVRPSCSTARTRRAGLGRPIAG